MAASLLGQKHKLPPGQNSDEWTIREKLTLASFVARSGDQNWSVSRTIKPILETGCCAVPRPPDFFSQKNCASHYSEMLEKVNTPKRKRTSEGVGTETPGDQIVRKLTFERIEELKKSITNDKLTYKKLKDRIEDVRSGKLDHQLLGILDEFKSRKKMRPPPVPQQEGEGSAPPITPTTPTSLITPTTHSGQQVMQPDIPKPPGSQPMSSPQKGKQLRVPKPTAKFQKYQQQLQQRHSHSSQSSPLSQQAEGPVISSDRSPGDGAGFSFGHGGSSAGGLGQTGAFSGSSQPIDADIGLGGPLGSHGEMAPPQVSPRRTDNIPQISPRQQGTSPSSLPTKQGSAESTLVSLLSQPPSKDDKHLRRPSGSEQEFPSPKELERCSSVSGQSPQVASPKNSPLSTASPQTPNLQNSDGKHFLGVTPSMESKKVDSMRERQGNIPQVVAAAAAATATAASPSVIAPTLSKLLAPETSIATSSSSVNATASHGGAIAKASGGVESSVIESSTVDCPVSIIAVGRESIEGNAAVLSVSTCMPTISVNPKAAALTATLPSPMAITPPPTTPPADRREIMTPKFEPPINTEKTSAAEVIQGVDENQASTARPSVEPPLAIPEVKVETVDSPVCSPRVTKRAAKPGRPGRPPRVARRNQRSRSKSTDNEADVEEEHDEETQFEPVDVGSEKTEDDEDVDSTADEKKDESDEEMERESGEEAVSDSGERSQSERDEPGTCMKEFLLDRAGIGGPESVPGSPASQVSQGSDEQEALQAQKTWKKSIMLVWRAAANHKYANVFLHPVTDDEAPGYHSVVFRPMDLSTIKKNIENGTIRTTNEFQRDMMLMFQNALMYNSADHDVYRMAEEMRDDVMEQIQSYIATQIMVDSKMLRGHRQEVFHIFL
ncbi:bromodomain-containing protein 8-like isoform X2 [Montipora capricornis]|uniref:bromodomain-containing protein 8-like isoform X2 n=1 Tax=Montipora capricornis TaxID=246305 RepID=UPI0035F10D3A